MANNGGFRWVKWLVVLIIILSVGGAIAWHHFGHQDTAPLYQTADVSRDDIIQAVTATGTLNPVTNVTVGSQISGNIAKLLVDWNSPVKANQIVAQIDPASYQSAMEQAEGDLSNAQATLELDLAEAKRADELYKSKLIDDSDHDTAIATYHQAAATVKMKQAALDDAKVNLERCTIYSPVDGIVISRNVDVGQTVAASMTAPILFIIANDLSKMQIDAQVAEADVGGVENGQQVNFTVDAFPYRTFMGTVAQIRNAPTNYQNVVAYDTVVSVNNPDLKLRPGMTATVSIIVAERTNVLRIPTAALRFHVPDALIADSKTDRPDPPPVNGSSAAPHHGQGMEKERGSSQSPARQIVRTIYLAPDKADQTAKPKPVQIKIGISDGIYTEVTEGLTEGQQVITGLTAPMDQAGAGANPFGRGFRRF